MKKIVFISKKSYYEFEKQLDITANRYETGGLLIGYKFFCFFFIKKITVSRVDDKSSLTSFQLNGNEHTKNAQAIIDSCFFKPHILGTWHTHICDYIFSKQDNISNIEMSYLLGESLAMLILPIDMKKGISFLIEHYTQNGNISSCEIFICKF